MKLKNVISVYNLKGGTGKTFFTFFLAMYLSKLKIEPKILVIDTDQQANTTTRFIRNDYKNYVENYNISLLYNTKLYSDDPYKIILPSKFNNIKILPSHLMLAQYEAKSYNNIKSSDRLMMFTNSIKNQFDYIIIDNPPAFNIFTINSFMASDYLLVPVVPEIDSLSGLEQLISIFDSARSFNEEFELLGIILNNIDKRYKSHITGIEETMRMFKNVTLHPIIAKKAIYQTLLSAENTDEFDSITKSAYGTAKESIEDMQQLIKNIKQRIDKHISFKSFVGG